MRWQIDQGADPGGKWRWRLRTGTGCVYMQAGGGANIMLGAIVGASLPAGPGGQARARPNDKHGRRRSWTTKSRPAAFRRSPSVPDLRSIYFAYTAQ